MSVTIEEGERQTTLLALAELSLRRPGWLDHLGRIADKFSGRGMFESFRETSADLVKSEGEQGFDEYANLVATVYGIEGQQIKPNDPRLQLPDNRCRVCLATLKEPQVLTPVRRQAHQFLQDGKHFKGCSA